MDHIKSISFNQQINIIENDTLELKKQLEESCIYTTDSKIYNAINDMISNILLQASSIKKTVKASGNQRLLKG